MEWLRNDLRQPRDESPARIFSRTIAGYTREIERLRSCLLEANPQFDFAAFREVMILSWEVPAAVRGTS